MTVAQFEAPGGPPQAQALRCFERLKDFLEGIGQPLEAARYLTVEVAGHDSLLSVTTARRAVFGDHRPRTVSNRFSRLPPGELVRVTVEVDRPVPAAT